ncbi:MAG TPA: BON domain-containing protein [Lacipirellulaceae bacterium]|nr:BON domain-containing protein [Lacipirellulaceae bacterium]
MSIPLSDARIRRAVARRLRASPYPDPAVKCVQCDFDRGKLTLRGRVHTFYEKQIAQEAIADVEGIDQVVNGVKVEST